MLRTIRKENQELRELLIRLRKASHSHEAPVWGAVAARLDRGRHRTAPVNVGHLDRLTEPQETVVVPGKLLAGGELHKPLTVAAFQFSEAARTKIHAAGGHAVSIDDLLKSAPNGSGVRLFA